MADDAAVLDAPVADETPLDTGVDDGAVDEGHESGIQDVEGEQETPDGEQDKTPIVPPSGEDESPVVDGKRLSEAAKTTLAEIKAKNPALANQLRTALFERDALQRQFPGGVREVAQLKTELEQYGGVDGVKKIHEGFQEFTRLDQEFASGDPKFVDAMATGDPAAFQKLAPVVFGKFAELNPEGFASYVCGVINTDAAANGIPLLLARMQDQLEAGNTAKAQELHGQLVQYFERLSTAAKKPVVAPAQPKAAANPEFETREKQLAEREQEITRNEWVRSVNEERTKVFDDQLKSLTAGRKLSDQQRAAIETLYSDAMIKAVGKIPNFQKNVEAYFKAKDKAGYLKYLGSVYKAEIPKALKAAVGAILPSKPGPRPAPSVTPAVPGRPAAAADGFVMVAKHPEAHEINMALTDMRMFKSHQAVLNDGRRVQWR
jgi:hypothetical protein